MGHLDGEGPCDISTRFKIKDVHPSFGYWPKNFGVEIKGSPWPMRKPNTSQHHTRVCACLVGCETLFS